MPLYEYQCDACGHRFEKIQKFSDPLVDTCPTCGGAVHKLVSSPAIQFKGSGFYITDYAKKDHVAAAKADSEGSVKSDKSEKSGKSETTEKADTSKTDKSSASSDTSSSSSSGASSTSAPAATGASAKDAKPAKDS